MLKKFTAFLMILVAVFNTVPAAASQDKSDEGKIDPKGIIFEHLGDAYGWEVPFNHHLRIPLPIIVFGDCGFHCFLSSRVAHGERYTDGDVTFMVAPKEPYDAEGNYVGTLDYKGTKAYAGKVVQILPDGSVYKPYDISITKNVLALFIAALLVIWSVAAVARWQKKYQYKAPRKLVGALEALIEFIYTGVIKPTLGDRSRKFAPYLLTVFFLILYLNLLGLIVIFPGGANVTGNIAVTLVLSIFTFLATNLLGTKHYWKEILWPDVPLWLKFPLPIMPLIEVFGIFTKPAALTVRLFANMLGGHMIVIVLTLLIFIFAVMGPAVTGATTVVSMLFSIFMLLIDVLVSFIQAYVFTMLSTLFISFGQEREHHHAEESSATESPVPATATVKSE